MKLMVPICSTLCWVSLVGMIVFSIGNDFASVFKCGLAVLSFALARTIFLDLTKKEEVAKKAKFEKEWERMTEEEAELD